MGDLARLRDQLYAALLATPLLAGCPGGGQRPQRTEAPADAGAPAEREPPPDAMHLVNPGVAQPFPTEGWTCAYGTWCGPTGEAEAHRDGAEDRLGCPVALSAPELDGMHFDLFDKWTQEMRDAGDAELCCYTWATFCLGGRPYGEPVRDDDRWLAAARTEHASVASFARASLELLAVGAPLELIAACHRAALDELRHAAACLAIASRHAGRTLELPPVPALPPRGGGIVRVAVDTYVEGCVAETHGAVVATRALPAWIARDEARHAALAWQIVAWAIRVGGAEVRDALIRVRVAPPRDASEEAHDVWREIIAPLTRTLLAA